MDGKEGQFFKSAPPKSKWENFKTLVWNSETHEFFGRTGISWLKITVFYIIFFFFLAAFWTCMLVIFYQTLKNDEPKWKLEGSRIGSSPGLGFRPQPPEANIDSTLIWFNGNNSKSIEYWVANLKDYIKPYTGAYGTNAIACGPNQLPVDGKVCYYPLEDINEACSVETSFSYPNRRPCVLIKLNRIFDWVPEPYEADDLPKDMPEDLKQKYTGDHVWITCDGENSADKDNIGEIEYTPSQGIPNYYFPFTNQKSYVSPFIFAHFKNPTPGVIINIECKAWAKNIKHERADRLGCVHFELLVD